MKNVLLTLALLGTAFPVAQATVLQNSASAYASGYTFRQMLDAVAALKGVDLKGVGFDPRGYVNVNLSNPADRALAVQKVTAAGLPAGILAFDGQPSGDGTTGTPTGTVSETPVTPSTPAGTTLPTAGTQLPQPHRAELTGPSTVRAGEANLWSFNLTNTGTAPIHLEHGACDVRFEVVNAAGLVLRPDPTNTICTMQVVVTDVAPGQTTEVQKIRWEGKDAAGQPVPAGQYTIRAVFRAGGTLIRAADFKVTVR